MEEMEGEMDDIGFRCKMEICVFCGNLIGEQNEKLTEDEISRETFVQGVNLILEGVGVVISDSELDWGAGGGKGDCFVGMICCGECYGLVEKVVRLNQLIRETQVRNCSNLFGDWD